MIDALDSHSRDSDAVQASIDWANSLQGAFVLALDVPTGVDPDSGPSPAPSSFEKGQHPGFGLPSSLFRSVCFASSWLTCAWTTARPAPPSPPRPAPSFPPNPIQINPEQAPRSP